MMSSDNSAGYPLVLHAEADPSRLGGTAICGFSTVGSVGVITTSHLISAFDAALGADIKSFESTNFTGKLYINPLNAINSIRMEVKF